jgi:hypothetical protein
VRKAASGRESGWEIISFILFRHRVRGILLLLWALFFVFDKAHLSVKKDERKLTKLIVNFVFFSTFNTDGYLAVMYNRVKISCAERMRREKIIT